MSKICTSLEQSKKLIELGIDVNTADMWYGVTYKKIGREDDDFGESIEYIELSKYPDIKENAYTKKGIPAWSLSALLGLMPLINHDTVNVFKEEDGTYTALYRYTKGSPVIIKKESAIDAAFEMICWLLENENRKEKIF